MRGPKWSFVGGRILRGWVVVAVGLSAVSCAGLFTPGKYDNYAGPAKTPTKMTLPSVEPNAPQKPGAVPAVPPSGEMQLTPLDAVLIAVQNNDAIRGDQYN